jgi:phosphoribosylaminoimidazolecarboxamide formyltransferase/IMP cyclohydrolase
MLEARARDVNGGATRKKSSGVGHHDEVLAASRAVGDLLPIKSAVVSVSDKAGLPNLGKILSQFGVEVIATEGSAAYLQQEVSDLKIIGMSDYTDFPENLNGRLKTLHPKLQAGVLAIKKFHDEALNNIAARYIDLVIVNLYPFEQTVRKGCSPEECIENIDVGGPSLLRAGAKNHPSVCVISDSEDYKALIEEMKKNNGCTTLAFRRRCAQKAFELTANYDRSIANWFASAPL